jgi:SAM-dependent methyltransferase
METFVTSLVRSIALSAGWEMARARSPKLARSIQFYDLDPEHLDGLNRNARRVVNLLRYTKCSQSAYSADGFDTGYHTVMIDGRTFAGQRDPAVRLPPVPFDFQDRTIVDLGCNQGGMLFQLAGQIRNGVGLDHDPRMINAANRRRAHVGAANLDFYVFDLQREHTGLLHNFLRNDSIDLIFLLSVCMWIENWPEVIAWCAANAAALLFESNGTARQQDAQLACLRVHYGTVDLLQACSTDDPSQSNRKLLICRN